MNLREPRSQQGARLTAPVGTASADRVVLDPGVHPATGVFAADLLRGSRALERIRAENRVLVENGRVSRLASTSHPRCVRTRRFNVRAFEGWREARSASAERHELDGRPGPDRCGETRTLLTGTDEHPPDVSVTEIGRHGQGRSQLLISESLEI